MGVTCLVRWKNATGMRDLTLIDEKVTKTLHGKSTGTWKLDFKVYRDAGLSTTKETRMLYQVSLRQQPSPIYCMVDGGVVVEADEGMDAMIGRLKNMWELRKKLPPIEGKCYDIGDFTLRVANILLGTYKGLLLEIDYHPCSTPNAASDLFKEFISTIVPPSAQLSCQYEYNYEQVGLSNREFTSAHTGYQYMMLFRNDRLL